MNNSITRKPSGNVLWDYVTGPSHFITETLRYLRGGKSVCLIARNNIPFRDIFFDRIHDTLNSVYFDFEYVIENTNKIGNYLIERLGLRAEYRSSVPEADFLRKKRALSKRLLHIVAKDGDNVRDCLDFIKSYKSISLDDGLFLLEISETAPVSQKYQKYIKILNTVDFITEYDSLLFAGLITDDTELSQVEKRYITAMAVSFFGADVECIDNFIRGYKIDQNPIDAIPEKFLADKDYSADERLWDAQVQELFPLIMRKTHDFIKTWRKPIDDAFEYISKSKSSDFPNGRLLNGHGEPINSPDELELATICFLMDRKRDENSDKRVLAVPSRVIEYKKLDFWRKLRNNIAHGKVCRPKDVIELLKT